MFVLQKIPTPPNPKCALNDVFVWKTSGSDWTHWWGTSSIGSTLVVEDSGLKKKWALAEVFLELERSCQSVQNGANINIYIYTHITYHMIISRYYVCISWMAPNHYQTEPKEVVAPFLGYNLQVNWQDRCCQTVFVENTMDTRKWHFGFQNGKGNSVTPFKSSPFFFQIQVLYKYISSLWKIFSQLYRKTLIVKASNIYIKMPKPKKGPGSS